LRRISSTDEERIERSFESSNSHNSTNTGGEFEEEDAIGDTKVFLAVKTLKSGKLQVILLSLSGRTRNQLFQEGISVSEKYLGC